ncbi:M20/M25/M40 family metallo-hydrolase [Monashia sp. NPDC004114]
MIALSAAWAMVAAVAGCTPSLDAAQARTSAQAASPSPATSNAGPSSLPLPRATAPPTPLAGPSHPAPSRTAQVAAPFDADHVVAGIRDLASIGPRDAASRTHDEAAAYVAARLRAAGYHVTLQQFRVPAGVSWGVRVPAGTAVNVLADPPGFDSRRPHLVVGAHLDTVPQSPGAEDNASGLMVMAEVARMARQQPAALPVRFVAFGAEEARGGTGTLYAFGSRHYVSALDPEERRATRGMVALDRVGVRTSRVPVCSGGRGTPALAQAVRGAAGPVRTRSCTNRASDHVSFEAVGIPAARLGSVPYAAYHSSRDVPSVVDRGQLERTGAVLWSWLQSARP